MVLLFSVSSLLSAQEQNAVVIDPADSRAEIVRKDANVVPSRR